MSEGNRAWNLESFVDALVVELDKTRETLALKAINKPLSYSVKDMSLDLQIFPTYDGNEVQFVTAGVGQEGASKLAIQLSSITDRQVRETSKAPTDKDDITIEKLDIDEKTKKELRKIGVTSANDIEKIQRKNVDLEPATRGKLNYTNLANVIQKKRRNNRPPKISRASLSATSPQQYRLVLEGDDLAVDRNFKPVAAINGQTMTNESFGKQVMSFSVPSSVLRSSGNELVVVTDPYSIVKMQIQNPD